MGDSFREDGYPIAEMKQLPRICCRHKTNQRGGNRRQSKGDALSKGLALIQGLWFTTQCIARVFQRLPVTELEVATAAFAVVNILIWWLWWSKPLDVRQPIVVHKSTRSESERMLVAPAPIAVTALREFRAAVLWDYLDYDPLLSTSVPAFWSMVDDDGPYRDYYLLVVTEISVGIVFGGIHCAAWNAAFPSTAEKWLWRLSSVFIAGCPAFLGCCWQLFLASKSDDDTFWTTFLIALGIGAPIYTICRVLLIILPLIALRAVPVRAFVDVDWSVYIPHL
ncbi:hypothetical protein B0H14DRAFT_2566591 [Mycena olivaceomarginata]|nr:hypothetical protein B0H14DRAFT_2566591 [Mycena olivaceomarginata]